MPMKKFINDPANLTKELLEGLVGCYCDTLALVNEKIVVRKTPKAADKVALVAFGGSGHEPAMHGFVGEGMLDACVAGDIFAAPGGEKVFEALDYVKRDAGTLLITLNHNGDRMSGSKAMRKAQKAGLKVVEIVIHDDIAQGPDTPIEDKRGLGGVIPFIKVVGAAAEAGKSLDEVVALANAFNDGPIPDGHWKTDLTDMNDEVHERKWEIDSLCYPLRLAYHYWKTTGDTSIFDAEWIKAIQNILTTFRDQQRRDGRGSYHFQRVTERALDTMTNDGWGNPVKPVGLIASSFRPSDDATTFQFLIPSNFFAVSSLRKAAEILTEVNNRPELAKECTDLAGEVETALRKYATYNHPKYGTIYAFEVDGFGNHLLMDDANVPSLIALPYLGDVDINDPIYQNTRRFVWSEDNPYFFKGTAGEGIGGPHIGYDMIWPMSIMMKAFTSQNDEEIKTCVKMLMDTEAGTGFMHESFHKDNPAKFTRAWFAWQNTLFGELILKLVNEGKLDLLNSIQ